MVIGQECVMDAFRVLHNIFIMLLLFVINACSSKYLADIPPLPTQSFSGIVTDIHNGEKISNAIVFLNGTEYRSETGQNGDFTINSIAQGEYELLILAPTYFNYYESIFVYDGLVNGTNSTEFKLQRIPAYIVDLPQNSEEAISILKNQVNDLRRQLTRSEAPIDQQWISNLQSFQRYFLGSELTSEINVINPQTLQFSNEIDNPNHILSVKSEQPVLIINNRLGYRVDMVIDTLVITKNRFGIDMHYQGINNFKEIEADDSEQEQIWETNREKSFMGSIQHFLMILPLGRLHNAGYELFSGVSLRGPLVLGSSESSVTQTGIFTRDVLRPSPNPHEFILQHPDELTITYRHINPMDNKSEFALIDWDMKRTYLKLNDVPIRFNSHGLVLNPDDMRVSGYWKYRQVIEMLPHYYNPHISSP